MVRFSCYPSDNLAGLSLLAGSGSVACLGRLTVGACHPLNSETSGRCFEVWAASDHLFAGNFALVDSDQHSGALYIHTFQTYKPDTCCVLRDQLAFCCCAGSWRKRCSSWCWRWPRGEGLCHRCEEESSLTRWLWQLSIQGVLGLQLGGAGTADQMAQMMRSPVMQSVLQNPEVLQNMMSSNPMIRQVQPDPSWKW